MPQYVPGDPTTWDTPQNQRRREQEQQDAIRPVNPARGPARPRRRPPPQQNPVVAARSLVDTAANAVTGFDARIKAAIEHPLSQYVPADVVLAVADSPEPDLHKSLTYIARQTALPASWLFTPWTGPAGREAYLASGPNGESYVISAARAENLAQKMTDPEVLKDVFRQVIDENGDMAVPHARRRVPTGRINVKTLASTMASLLKSGELEGMTFEEMLGAAMSIGTTLSKKQLRDFEQNLAVFKGTKMPQGNAIAAAEAAAVQGVRWDSEEAAFQDIGFTQVDENGNTYNVLDRGQGTASRVTEATFGARWFTDAAGNPHTFKWDPISKSWQESAIPLQEVLNHPEWRIDGPPQDIEDLPANEPTTTGGAAIGANWIDRLSIQAAGWTPGSVKWDLNRPKDYWVAAREAAHQYELDRIAAEGNPIAYTLGRGMHWAGLGFQLASGGLLKAWTYATTPVVDVVLGTAAGNEYQSGMESKIEDVIFGRETLGSLAVFDPDGAGYARDNFWAHAIAMGADMAIAYNLDPLWVVGRGAKVLKEAYTATGLASAAGFGYGDAASTRGLGAFGDLLDKKLGTAVFGNYASDGERWAAAVDNFLAKPREFLGGRTIPEYIVDVSAEGGDVYTKLNEKFRPLLQRQAFDPQTIINIDRWLGMARQSESISREEQIQIVTKMFMAHSGVPGAISAGELARFTMYEQAPEEYVSRVKSPGVSRTSEGVLRPGWYINSDREQVVMETVIPNVVGDVRYSSAKGVEVGKLFPEVVKPQPITITETSLYDFEKEVGDQLRAIESTMAGASRTGELPRYSRVTALDTWINHTKFGESYLGRWLDAPLARIPEANVGFEAGQFEENVSRRMARASRWFTRSEQEALIKEAREISLVTNPNREEQMRDFLDRLERTTFNHIADDMGLGSANREHIWAELNKVSQQVKADSAKELYNVDVTYKDGVAVLTRGKEPILETQLLNSWYSMDPLAMRKAVTQAVGLQKATANVFAHILGVAGVDVRELELSEARLLKFSEKAAHSLARGYLKIWKPFAVLRPGYVLRVPGFDEQIRFLADRGLVNRLSASKSLSKLETFLGEHGLLGRASDTLGEGWRYRTLTFKTADGAEHSFQVLRPGYMLDDIYANTGHASEFYLTMKDQVDEVIKGAARRAWNPVAPGDAYYEENFARALNGHIGGSTPGRIALSGIVQGDDVLTIERNLVTWSQTAEGKTVLDRIGVLEENRDAWAREIAETVNRYTAGQASIAYDALHGRASYKQVEATIEREFRAPAREYLGTIENQPVRDLAGIDGPALPSSRRTLWAETRKGAGNPDGGGATFDPETGKLVDVKNGYVVATNDTTAVSRAAGQWEDPQQFKEALDEYIANNREYLATTKGAKIGTYVEGANDDNPGRLHIDTSVVVEDKNTAIGIGMERKQYSVYDAATQTSPRVYKPPTIHGQTLEHGFGGVAPHRPFVDKIGRWIVEMPTNKLSRQPFFKSWYEEMLSSQAEILRTSGWVPRDAAEAERVQQAMEAQARQFALDRVNRVMFNFADQNRLSEMMNFVAPFMQPWFEAFSVYGHLLRRNPGIIGVVNRMFNEATDDKTGFLEKDPDTGEWVMPMPALMRQIPFTNIAAQWSGFHLVASLSSFNLFFNNAFPAPMPYGGTVNIPLPSLSPPVTALLQSFVDNDPNNHISQWLYQYGSLKDVRKLLPFPTWMHNLINTGLGVDGAAGWWDPDQYNSIVEEFLRTSQLPEFDKSFKNDQERLDWAESQARTMFAFKTFTSLFFPAAPRVRFPVYGAESYLREQIAKYPDDFDKAREAFLQRYPNLYLTLQAKTVWEGLDPRLKAQGISTPAVPANELTSRILNMPGIKELAARYPGMIFAILPQEAYARGDYSPDIFMQQLALGQRKYLSPEEFLSAGQESQGWQAYWAIRERWNAQQQAFEDENVSESDPAYITAKAKYDEEIGNLRDSNVYIDRALQTHEDSVISVNTLSYLRELTKNKVFMDFPAGKGLAAYFDLRKEIAQKMADASVTSLDNVAARRLGILDEYNQGVQDIIAKYADFDKVYAIFFEGQDLMKVKSTYAKEFEALNLPPDSPVFDWQKNQNDLKDAIASAPDAAARNPLYTEEARNVNDAYENYGTINPAIAWYELQNASDKRDYDMRTYTKSFPFLNRLEKDHILGIDTTYQSEELWAQYNDQRAQISEFSQTIPGYDASTGYKALNIWVLTQTDPTFQAQVALANTWGGTFFQAAKTPSGRNTLLGQGGPAGDAWNALKENVASYQAVIEAAGLHGTGSDVAVYNALRDQFSADVEALKEQSPSFAAQWDAYETASSADLTDTFFPPIWYRLGDVSD